MMMGVIGEWQNERVVAGGMGELGEEEALVEEGAHVFGTEIPNPHELRVCHKSTVSEV